MARSNSIASKSIESTNRIERERTRPVILFYLEFSKREVHVVDAVIKNTGFTPAYDIKVSLDPELRRFWNGGISNIDPIEPTFSFLPPGEFIADSLGLINAFHLKYPDAKFEGKVEYHDRTGKIYRESFVLDYNYRKRVGIAILSKRPTSKSLESIDQRLKQIAQALERFDRH